VGQKIHPGGMRVGVIHDWKSNWWTGKKEFPQYILEDVKIREHIYKKLAHAGLSDILIRKDKQRITVDIYTARPGIVIGKSGVEVDALRKELHAMTQKNVHININEIKRPELDAKLVAQSIAEQLSNRVAFRRAMKRALASAIRSGAAGVKIQCSGRLGGGEMSRRETYNEGRVPLHTIRADIDYGFVEARTGSGRIGVKVWINKGEIMPEGFESITSGGDTRLGDQDARRRRGGATEGLGASRESGRGRGPDREGLGPERQRRRGPGGGGGGAGGPGGAGGGTGRGRGAGGGGQGRGARPGARPAGGPNVGARPAGGGGGGSRPAGGGGRPRKQENVEKPRTDENAVSAEGREQPVIEPQVEETPKPVADAPDTTTPKQQVEDPTKLDQSGDPSQEKSDN
jgi:small subunit ribosomal protein S3